MKTNLIKRLITIAATVAFTLAMGAGGAHAGLKDNNNGTITDTAQNLVWLKNANCFGPQNWQTATNNAAGLSSGACGLTDKSSVGQWRLPTKDELAARPANKAGFTNIQATDYWSSSNYTYGTDFAWVVRMYGGSEGVDYKGNHHYVWPVRAGQ